MTDLPEPYTTGTPSAASLDLYYKDIQPYKEDAFPETKEFLQSVVDVLLDYVKSTNDRSEKVLDFHHPAELLCKLDLDVPANPLPLQQLVQDCITTLRYHVKTGHPRYLNQLTCGLDTISLAGEWLTAAANTNMFTYEIAPVFILMEKVVLKKMRSLIGWEGGDSIFAPGGAISNLYAFLAARHKMFPTYKEKGNSCIKGHLVMYASDQCHYSVKMCAAVGGLGTDFCIKVASDDAGRLIPSELDRLVAQHRSEGLNPFFVCATAGTTVLGAFDPISEIADVCEKYGIWLHVDAAWGGGLLFSKKYRKGRLAEIERADSVAWNPHKLMGTLNVCSTVHFKEDGLLLSCNKMSAEYLFMTDKLYDVRYDTGDEVIQCGRQNDIFKLWLQWRGKGTVGYEQLMHTMMDLTLYMVKKIKDQPEKYYLIMEPECTNVCFWYVPKRLREVPHDKNKEEELGKICPILKGRMLTEGTLMVSYQPNKSVPNFFRNVICSEAVQEQDIDFLLAEMDRLGNNL